MRIVVTGASGQLGSYLRRPADRGPSRGRRLERRDAGVARTDPLRPVELTDDARPSLRALDDADPDVVIHAGGDQLDRGRAPRSAHEPRRSTSRQPGSWPSGPPQHDRRLVYHLDRPCFRRLERSWYREDDPAAPILAYGQTKHAAERFVLAHPAGWSPGLRLLYGPSRSGERAFSIALRPHCEPAVPQAFLHRRIPHATRLRHRGDRLGPTDRVGNAGTIHVGGPERLSRFELMSRAAATLGIDRGLVRPNHRNDSPFPEPRPADVSLDSSRLCSTFPDLARPRVEEALPGVR